jgi:hypothetical protein
MTSPRRSRGGDGAAALAGGASLRGGLLIAAAVILGVVLLGKGFDTGFIGSSGGDPSDESATGGNDDDDDGEGEGDDEASTTTTPVTHVPAEVRVQVLNGGGPAGSAGLASTALGTTGFVVVDATNAAVDVAATTVFVAAGYEADAAAVIAALGLTTTPQPMPTPPPATEGGPSDATVNIFVVLGPDFTPPG